MKKYGKSLQCMPERERDCVSVSVADYVMRRIVLSVTINFVRTPALIGRIFIRLYCISRNWRET